MQTLLICLVRLVKTFAAIVRWMLHPAPLWGVLRIRVPITIVRCLVSLALIIITVRIFVVVLLPKNTIRSKMIITQPFTTVT